MANTRARKPPQSANGSWADSAEEWRGRNLHNVYLPSGTKATISFPELGPLVLANALPEELVELGRQEITHEMGVVGAYGEELVKLDSEKPEDVEKAKELTRQFTALLKWLVAEHVLVAPKVTVEQLSENSFPLQDLDWLYGVATRRVNEDGMGRRIGVARLDVLATFPEAHGCPPDCPQCVQALQRLSTADLGSV